MVRKDTEFTLDFKIQKILRSLALVSGEFNRIARVSLKSFRSGLWAGVSEVLAIWRFKKEAA